MGGAAADLMRVRAVLAERSAETGASLGVGARERRLASDGAWESSPPVFAAIAALVEFSATAEPFVALAGVRPEPRGAAAFHATASEAPQPPERGPAFDAGDANALRESRSASGELRFPLPRPLPEGLLASADGLLLSEDRTRMAEFLGLVDESLLNPYEQSTIKGDRPVYRDDWYLSVGLESVTTLESGRVLDRDDASVESLYRQQLFPSVSLIRGMTTFRPPDWHFHVRAGASLQSAEALALRATESRASGRDRRDLSVEELFVERHLFNVSDRYDFQSLRVGVQPFITDFRGFLLDDHQPAIRWFGNASNNRIQHNVAWIRRLEKDPVSGLNSSRLRDEDLLVANLYLQDVPWLGFQLQGLAMYHRDRDEGDVGRGRGSSGDAMSLSSEAEPDRHDVVYVGASGDGHVGRLNLTMSTYAAFGRDRGGPIASGSRSVAAYFGAAEASVDFDWYRLKLYGMLASGDSDPDDGRSGGFDVVRDRATFAGLEDGFWQRESLRIPMESGADLLLVSSDGLLPSLRSTGNRDSASFVNPGLRLVGVGADFDVLPELRLRLNASYMEFDDAATLRFLRGGREVRRHLGEDYSIALIYRPWFINNVIVRVSAAAFRPGGGLVDLGSVATRSDSTLYSARLRLTLSY